MSSTTLLTAMFVKHWKNTTITSSYHFLLAVLELLSNCLLLCPGTDSFSISIWEEGWQLVKNKNPTFLLSGTLSSIPNWNFIGPTLSVEGLFQCPISTDQIWLSATIYNYMKMAFCFRIIKYQIHWITVDQWEDAKCK